MNVSIKKATAYEAVCRAFNIEVHPEDYGFAENDYESLWEAAVRNGHLMMVEDDGTMFRDDNGCPVYLYKECYFDTPQELQFAFKAGMLAIDTLVEIGGLNYDDT